MSAPRLVHLTTTDISLELLLGPQLSAFVEAGYDVVGVSAPGPFVPQIEARGVRHVPLANATRAMAPHKDLLALGELRSLFKELQPAIVHTHNPKPGLYGRMAAKAARVPCIVNTVHGLYALPDDRLAKRSVVYTLERIASTCSDAELVQNPEDLTTLRDTLKMPRSKLALLGNGVDMSRFASAADRDGRRARVRAELGATDDTVVVGAVGRMVLEKGYAELFEAWDRLRADLPQAMLVVVGPDDDDKADSVPRDLVERARATGVKFLGMRADVEDLYCGFDVYVLASHREGFPRSAMEAAAGGLPIIATDIRGCRQVVADGQTGLLVPVRSPDGLERAVRELVTDDDRRRAMGQAASVRALQEFDQQRVIDLTLLTYRKLLLKAGLPLPTPVAAP